MLPRIQRVEKEIQPGMAASMFDKIIQESLSVWLDQLVPLSWRQFSNLPSAIYTSSQERAFLT